MPAPLRKVSPNELPRVLIYSTAITCAALSALMLQIQFERIGLALVSLGHDAFSGKMPKLRAAGPWWAMAALALIVGGAVGAALSRFPFPWHRFRVLRWLIGAIIVFILADIGHSAAAPPGVGAAAQLAVSLAALVLAALMGMLGAYITTGRRHERKEIPARIEPPVRLGD
jgi:hypothetical protein